MLRSLVDLTGQQIHRHPLLAAVPAIVALLLASWVVVHAWPTWNTDCDVQLSPYLVNVEIDGWKAGAQCEHLIADHASSGYHSSAVDGPAVCQQTYDGFQVSVHDPGNGVVGALFCSTLPPPSAHIAEVVR